MVKVISPFMISLFFLGMVRHCENRLSLWNLSSSTFEAYLTADRRGTLLLEMVSSHIDSLKRAILVPF